MSSRSLSLQSSSAAANKSSRDTDIIYCTTWSTKHNTVKLLIRLSANKIGMYWNIWLQTNLDIDSYETQYKSHTVMRLIHPTDSGKLCGNLDTENIAFIKQQFLLDINVWLMLSREQNLSYLILPLSTLPFLRPGSVKSGANSGVKNGVTGIYFINLSSDPTTGWVLQYLSGTKRPDAHNLLHFTCKKNVS